MARRRAGGTDGGFDRLVAVDWSAAATPRTGADSIWVASAGRRGPVRTDNPPTRGAAEARLIELLDRALGAGERVLVGYDFSFGYPVGTAALFPAIGGAPSPRWARPWEWLERRLHDTAVTNANDRFAVAAEANAMTGLALFFGRPPSAAHPHLAATRREVPPGLAPNPFPPFRLTEQLARRQVGSALCSGWHLYGGVTVGSQILTGLPHLVRLRRRYGPALTVWPQACGFGPEPMATHPAVRIVVVELWPTALAPQPVPGEGVVRDRAQVRAAVVALRHQLDAEGLAAWFDPPSVLAMQARARLVAQEEGWILGIL